MIKTYISNTDVLNDDLLFSNCYKCVSDERQRKIDRVKFRKDKNLSLGAGILLNYGLKKENINTENLTFLKQNNGKPYLKDHNIEFNLSHSGSRVICCISDIPVGCDVEKTEIGNRDLLKIAGKYFFDKEYEYITACKNESEKTDMFFRLWTLKESFMKATGLGMSLPLNDFMIDINSSIITVRHKLDDSIYYEKELNIESGYKYAVCSKNISDLKTEIADIETIFIP